MDVKVIVVVVSMLFSGDVGGTIEFNFIPGVDQSWPCTEEQKEFKKNIVRQAMEEMEVKLNPPPDEILITASCKF